VASGGIATQPSAARNRYDTSRKQSLTDRHEAEEATARPPGVVTVPARHWLHIYDVAAGALPGVTATRVRRRLGTGVRAAMLQPEMLLHAVQSSGTASSPEQQNRETNV
jgi:hypothetical protein